MTVLQEPVQAAIWQALNHYAYRDAVFLAERLYAEVHSEEALFLLATCYYRSGKAYKAYRLLKGHSCTTPQCKYLLAKCCVDLSKLAEGEQILSGGVFNKQKSHDDIVTEFGDSACFTLSLLGHVYCKTDRLAKGSECYQKSLSLNPFLWSPFESLCEIGEKPDPDQTFKLTSLQNFSNCLPSSCTTLVSNHSLSHRQPETVLTETPQDTIELNRLNLESSNSKYSLNTDSSVSYIDSAVISPDTVPLGTGTSILSKQVQNKPKTGRSLLGGPAALSPLTPSFGILPLETPSPGDGSYLQNYTNTSSVIDVPSTGAPSKKTFCVLQSVARIGQTGTKSVFSQSGNSREVTPILVAQTQSSGPQTSTTPQVLSPTITSPPNALPRRSSRLFTSDSSTTKENSKKLKMKFPPKIPNRKTKSKTNKGGITQPNINDSLEITKLDSSIISEGKISTITPQIQAFNLQKAAAEGLMSLLREMGKGYLALCSYNCKEAINILSHLPSHHYNTGWVLCQIGRAYFELSEYMQAERIFSEVRRIENYRVEGMEIYSTTLWHLQKDVALSVLSKDLTDMDKNSPEAWCAAGNCFSLQREHDIAIKFFQRAIQVDPNYAYAYTLLGHEFVLTEELDKALACFRNAIRVNPRHYNAWYGLGMIYYKQEKFSLAEMHFQKALDINPQSSVLLCHIGVVQHALKKSEKALDTLNKAIVIDPKNPLCKFHRASVLFANEKYKVYKKLGQTHLALMNFSWAMDLDPKGANNQIKEAIDKRYLPDDEEPITQEEQIMGTDESQESSMTDADDTQLHAAESDEF
ncbi:cell division cycle protein 27 homolog isoform X6 [Mirounga angustirostris]|uniref:Cell division cycle protein 27 homolog n=1 Tax=Callorhinus ursinus TaxID=34884 RepID=A0A3Q7RYI4_CALUR|nr:cell division cycle protein 27 homolog isoform X5 [Callorhinus ursinus]XP_025745881.1 cell division cycle protein 27 homolog isoform X5 [Callorhinus ursinus]XP_027943299.1 cell division cycle protein 27 homolog isoform X5 [Eumetopias jubatus]XP_041581348.1 cell division cycle protein 27 homolog isoform X6 [Vulpes lagopus]